MTALIIRDLNEHLGEALKREAKKRSTSVNQLVKQYIATGLQQSHAVSQPEQRNDLAGFAGRWSSKDLREFNAATQGFDQIETDLWK